MIRSGRGWTMHLGDCLEVLPGLEAVDHVITDPPYELEAHTKQPRRLKDAKQKRGVANCGDVRRVEAALPFPAITPEVRTAASLAIGRLARRWTIVFCQIEAIAAWRAELEAAGLDWIRGGIWRKPDGAPQFTGERPGQGFESIAIAHARGRKRWNGGGKHAVWTVPCGHGRDGQRNEHRTTKPAALMVELTADFTEVGDTILDPFAGSGTTGVAALRLGRSFVVVERDPGYFALACERLEAEAQGSTLAAMRGGQVALFGTR